MKLIKEIDLIEELEKIRDLPEHSGNSCHDDHEEMSSRIDNLIIILKDMEKKSIKSKGKEAISRLRGRN